MWVCPRCCAPYADGRFCPVDGEALAREELHVPGLQIEHELGRGLTGAVWSARAANGERMAVKVLHREWCTDPEMRERFDREALAAAAISHPCVVAPIATGVLEDGRPYLVMELVDGPSLEDVLALGPLPEPRAVAIAIDLADALAAVHRAGVLHRDVKPGNVRIGRDGRARLLDFGVARRVDADEARITAGGLTVGTPHYMAPEQCNGDEVGPRADVYALGVLLFRMLTGEVPFDGAAVAVMLAHAARPAPRVRERVDATPALDALVARCLAKRPDDRLDAAELGLALAMLADRGAVDPHAVTQALADVPLARFARAETVPADDEATGPAEDAPVRCTAPHPPRAARETPRLVAVETAEWRPRRRRAPAILGVMVTMAAIAAGAVVSVDAMRGTPLGGGLAAASPLHVAGMPLPRLDVAAPDLPEVPRRYLIAVDGSVALRLGAPIEIRPGTEQDLTIEAWDSTGAPIDTMDLVVTFAGPRGAALGLAADPTRDRGVYRVRARFDRAGDWTIRVFPPIGDTMVTFHLDVSRPIPTS